MEVGPKRMAQRLVGLAEVLCAQGNLDDAFRIIRVALRGFVTLADHHRSYDEGFHLFVSALEYFSSHQCPESAELRNSLIRLYGRFLTMKHAYLHDWDHIEHPILRSCLLHGLSGGAPSALADLKRKCESWRMNPDTNYVVTTGFPKDGAQSQQSDSDSDAKQYIGMEIGRRRQMRYRGVTEKLIRQRQSPILRDWASILGSSRSSN